MIIKSRKKIIDLATAFFIFLLFSMPSVKLVYSTELINVLVIFGLLITLIFRFKLIIDSVKLSLLIIWLSFSLVLVSGYFVGNHFEVNSFFRTVYLVVSVFLVIIHADYRILIYTGKFLFFWGAMLSVWQLTLGVPINPSLGQNYLTVSLPIGVFLAYCLSGFFGSKQTLPQRIFLISSFLLGLISVSTILSRSAIIFVVLIALILFCFYGLSNVSRSNKFKLYLVLTSVLSIIFSSIFTSINLRQGQRILRLFNNPGEESRVAIYLKALKNISNFPITGNGTNSSQFLYGNYPHNLVLDILSQGGVLLFIPSFLFFCIFIYFSILFLVKNRFDRRLVAVWSAITYFVLQWNTSFDLSTSYIVFGGMALFIVGFTERPRSD